MTPFCNGDHHGFKYYNVLADHKVSLEAAKTSIFTCQPIKMTEVKLETSNIDVFKQKYGPWRTLLKELTHDKNWYKVTNAELYIVGMKCFDPTLVDCCKQKANSRNEGRNLSYDMPMENNPQRNFTAQCGLWPAKTIKTAGEFRTFLNEQKIPFHCSSLIRVQLSQLLMHA